MSDENATPIDLSDTLGPVGQKIEDELAALAARIDAIQQAQPVDLQPILDRLDALEAFDASLKIIKLDDAWATALGKSIRDSLIASLDGADAVEGPDATEPPA